MSPPPARSRTAVVQVGSGAPVTLVVPGFGATAGEARLGAAGLPGTRVLLSLPGHHDAPDPVAGELTYLRLAPTVLAAADACGALDAVGTSLGAGCLLAVLAAHPERLRSVVLLLPAALDVARTPTALDAALASGDPERVRAVVAAEVPEGVDVGAHVLLRTQALLRLRHAAAELAASVPVPDLAALAEVRTQVLVVAATGDPLHPLPVARAVVAALPHARLEVVDSRSPLLTHRSDVRRLTAGHLRSAAREQPA